MENTGNITVKEAQKIAEELMAQGTTEEELLKAYYKMFQDNKIDLEELRALCHELGYEFSEEFENMTPEQQKTEGLESGSDDEDGGEEPTKEDIEKTKEFDDDNDSNKGEDNKSTPNDNDNNSEPNDKANENEDGEEDSPEEEEKKARKLYGFE